MCPLKIPPEAVSEVGFLSFPHPSSEEICFSYEALRTNLRGLLKKCLTRFPRRASVWVGVSVIGRKDYSMDPTEVSYYCQNVGMARRND